MGVTNEDMRSPAAQPAAAAGQNATCHSLFLFQGSSGHPGGHIMRDRAGVLTSGRDDRTSPEGDLIIRNSYARYTVKPSIGLGNLSKRGKTTAQESKRK